MSDNNLGLYYQLKDLGCSNPLQCLRELIQNGVTKFYNYEYTEVTIRLNKETGKFVPTWRVRGPENKDASNRERGKSVRKRSSK